MLNKLPESSALETQELYEQLDKIYGRDYPQDNHPYLHDMLLKRLPYYTGAITRRKLDLIAMDEANAPPSPPSRLERWIPPALMDIWHNMRDRIGLVAPEARVVTSYLDLKEDERRALAPFFDMQVRGAHFDVAKDLTLSNDDHTIEHFEAMAPIMAHRIMENISHKEYEKLGHIGAVFFDVDGTKTIVDCAGPMLACTYLENLGAFLSKPTAEVQTWLKENGLRSEAYSFAGDEFIVLLRRDTADQNRTGATNNEPVTKDIMDAFARVVQEAMKKDKQLKSSVSFDDKMFVMKYDGWSQEDIGAYEKDPDAMRERWQKSRNKLPKEGFTPSVSCGSATLLEALAKTLDQANDMPLKKIGISAYRQMIESAADRMKTDKLAFREQLRDSQLKEFLLRNAENRKLMRMNSVLRIRNAELESIIAESRETRRKA